ncbi:MAG TPA: hypothetical protein VHT71_27700 [Methylomirabilota bacterium]|nr:hypothetical protein [Methylomirabilota bacterium]
MRMRRPLAVLLLTAAGGGCAWLPSMQPGTALLERGDQLSREGAFEAAVTSYNDYLTQYPGSEAASRVRASRDTLRALLSAREELARSQAELVRLREDLARMRDDLARRDHDLFRVRQESERLKTDLERLKQIDLKLERRK